MEMMITVWWPTVVSRIFVTAAQREIPTPQSKCILINAKSINSDHYSGGKTKYIYLSTSCHFAD